MLANYGYKDGSGDFFITIDTDKCDGCGDCVPACPAGCFEVGEDPNDPYAGRAGGLCQRHPAQKAEIRLRPMQAGLGPAAAALRGGLPQGMPWPTPGKSSA